MKKAKTKQPNIIITATASNKASGFYVGNRKLLFDNRLSHQERNILNILLVLKDFKLTTKATSEFLNISEPTFIKVINNLKSLGYCTIERNGKNFTYHFTDESKYIPDFKPANIRYYSIEQLNALYNNAETPSKYKNLLKKYFDSLSKDEETYNCVLSEIENYETPKDIYKKQLDEEREQANEDDILNYLKGNY